ncbi:MAG: DUF4176 domain-containing protein [Lachnospiraceae bacterium]|nr:DUF4176 domain-containing protein [Lachnospiraceae bacterium]MDY3817663.1 DUF4176 domain-containing protein [Lachnospiraceae bacterium]
MIEQEKYLPLGTVVRLKTGIKPIMITGRRQRTIDNPKEYDYIACLYPEGHIAPDKNILFNHEDIDEILFMGFESELEEIFANTMLKAAIDE